MEDETTEELSIGSEYSDSFIATDDDVEEELTWDSEDSRPPGPSPNISSSFGPPNLRRRRWEMRRIRNLSDSESDNSSEVTIVRSEPSSPSSDSTVRLHSVSQDTSDSDRTYVSDRVALELMASPLPSPRGNEDVSRSPEYPLPDEMEAQSRHPQYLPLISETGGSMGSPASVEVVDQAEGNSRDTATPLYEPDVIVIQSSPNSPQAHAVDPGPQAAAVEVTALKRAAVEEAAKVLNSSVSSEGEDASLCTICMCPLTNSGSHRVVCLRCGHIFGQSCVERWIKCGLNSGARRCPTCNKKACLKDIRVLYLPKVIPLDTSERDRLQQEKDELALKKKMVESDLSRTILQHKLVVERYEKRIQALEERLLDSSGECAVTALSQGTTVVASTVVSPDGGCRVMTFNCLRQEVVVSQPSGNTVFAGFGVRVVNSVDWQPSRFILLHNKMVRDMQFHGEDRDLLLSASLDTTAKLVDLANTTTVHTFKEEGPLWSCSWDASNPHLLLLGSQMGKVSQYDRRMMNHYVNMWEMENNRTPVVALSSAVSRADTSFPQGGFLSCRLNAVFSHPRHGEKYGCEELPLEGPFMSMRYNVDLQTILTTSRPSSRSPHTRVSLNALQSDRRGQVCAPIHTFNCGSSARLLSRATFLPYVDNWLVVAHNESGRTLDMWNFRSGDRFLSVPVRDPIIDLLPVCLSSNNMPLVAALSEKKLCIYRIN